MENKKTKTSLRKVGTIPDCLVCLVNLWNNQLTSATSEDNDITSPFRARKENQLGLEHERQSLTSAHELCFAATDTESTF